MKKMRYTMAITNNLAIAKNDKCEGFVSMPVSYAFEHMKNVSEIGKREGIAIEWKVIFE